MESNTSQKYNLIIGIGIEPIEHASVDQGVLIVKDKDGQNIIMPCTKLVGTAEVLSEKASNLIKNFIEQVVKQDASV